jgi:predicted acetyltransferase
MEIRNLTDKERAEARWLHRYAFGEWSDQDLKEEEMTYLQPKQTIGLFDNSGKLVSTVAVIDFQQSIRGVIKRMGGIAEVGTYPEARYQGNIRKLMKYAFVQMHKNGFPVSMLAPFKESYYMKFGYAKANAPYIVVVPNHAIRYALSMDLGPDWIIERYRAQDVQKQYFEFFNAVPLNQFHGFITFSDISPQVWKMRCKDSLIVFVKQDGKTLGMARYRIQRKDPRDEDSQELNIIDFYWANPTARSKLLNFFAKHADQVQTFTFHVPFDVKIEHWFKDITLQVKRFNPWMVRVLDVETALSGLPGEGEDELRIQVIDGMCEWNNHIFALRSENDILQVQRTSGTSGADISINALSALVYGTLPVEELEYHGFLQIKEEWVRHTLNRWFPTLPIFNPVYF